MLIWRIFIVDVFQSAVNKGVRNISFGDLSGNLGRTMYLLFLEILNMIVINFFSFVW